MAQSMEAKPLFSRTSSRPSTTAIQTLAALGMLGIALIHLLDAPSKFEETPYQGWLFVALIVASMLLADRLLRSDDSRVWALAGLTAAATIVAFVISRTIGLPSAANDVGEWEEPLALASLFVEGIVVWLVLMRLRPLGREGSAGA